ncbi:ImmA/IrrE family metallo-endopeptidase [Vibrio fluvialis]|nr:ImmA/IrrE family metallo-endopeptidase [Vibrio fluvialis]
MKAFDIDKLMALEDNATLTKDHSSLHDLNNAVELLYWIDEREQDIPYAELIRRGYISSESKDKDTFNLVSKKFKSDKVALFKSGDLKDSERRDTIVMMWESVVYNKANSIIAPEFNPEVVDQAYLTKISKLSENVANLNIIGDVLFKDGIILVIEKKFDGLGKDGCVFKNKRGNPVISISLRYDRFDNFWFTLLHELAHISLHFDRLDRAIVEDIYKDDSDDEIESEANYLAKESIVPRKIWRSSGITRSKSVEKLYDLAKELGVHPSLLAGRARFETKDWRLFSDVINEGSPSEVLGI